MPVVCRDPSRVPELLRSNHELSADSIDALRLEATKYDGAREAVDDAQHVAALPITNDEVRLIVAKTRASVDERRTLIDAGLRFCRRGSACTRGLNGLRSAVRSILRDNGGVDSPCLEEGSDYGRVAEAEHAIVEARKKHRHAFSSGAARRTAPNTQWCIDLKGEGDFEVGATWRYVEIDDAGVSIMSSAALRGAAVRCKSARCSRRRPSSSSAAYFVRFAVFRGRGRWTACGDDTASLPVDVTRATLLLVVSTRGSDRAPRASQGGRTPRPGRRGALLGLTMQRASAV